LVGPTHEGLLGGAARVASFIKKQSAIVRIATTIILFCDFMIPPINSLGANLFYTASPL